MLLSITDIMSINELCDKVSSLGITTKSLKCPPEFSKVHKILQNTAIRKRFSVYVSELRRQIYHLIGSENSSYFLKDNPLKAYLVWLLRKSECLVGIQRKTYENILRVAFKASLSVFLSFPGRGTMMSWMEFHTLALKPRDRMLQMKLLRAWCMEVVFTKRLKNVQSIRDIVLDKVQEYGRTVTILQNILEYC